MIVLNTQFFHRTLYLQALTVYASNLDIKKRHSEIDSRSQLPTKTILGTCAEYNFKHPHCCSPPDCEFMVSWVDTGDGFVSFTLIADISDNTSVWAALGFSDNNKMVSVFERINCFELHVHGHGIEPHSIVTVLSIGHFVVEKDFCECLGP